MKARVWMWTAAPLAMLAAPAWATPQAAAPIQAESGVLIFTPDFFAEAAPNTAYDMIGRLPGFTLNIGEVGKRGLAGAAGNVVIDGQPPSSKSDTLDQILKRISAASVERVELVRGGAPGIDMQGQAVVANVVLKRDVQVERVLESNMYIYQHRRFGPLLKGQYSRREGDRLIGASISATTDHTDGTGSGSRLRFDPAGNLTQAADLDRWDHLVIVTATGVLERPLAGGHLRLHALAAWDKHNRNEDVLIRAGAGPDEATREQARAANGELGGDWTRALGPRTELVATGLQHLHRDTYDGLAFASPASSDFTSTETTGESVGRAVIRFRPSSAWSWESGGEAAYNFLDSKIAYIENGAPVALPNASVRVEELRGEVFSQATWRMRDNLTLEGGLRIEASKISQTGDSNQSKTFVYPKPRLQLTWTPKADNQFRLRIEREVSQLDFAQFVASSEINLGAVQGGNADLEPQKTTTYELVYERRFWGKGAMVLTAAHVDAQDVIDVIPLAGGLSAIGNIGDGIKDSFEARLTLPMDRLGLPNARLQARGAWFHIEVTDPLTGEKRPATDSQAFGCGLSFDQDLAGGRWTWGWGHGCNVDLATKYRITEVRRSAVQPYTNVFLQWKPSSQLTVRLDLNSFAGQESFSRRYLYAGPRNTAPLRLIEERRTDLGPWAYIQIRKTL